MELIKVTPQEQESCHTNTVAVGVSTIDAQNDVSTKVHRSDSDPCNPDVVPCNPEVCGPYTFP